jgi:hypothetical protein
MAIGGAFAAGAINLKIGHSARMGPGYFPFWLGIILAGLGLIISLLAFRDAGKATEKIGGLAWRPLIAIICANLIFGVMLGGINPISLPPAGLIPAVVVAVVVASAAGEGFRLVESLVLGAILAVCCYVIFIKMLKLPFQAWPAFIAG